jgi:hypothetical protein
MLPALFLAAAISTSSPLREVVYKVSFTRLLDSNQETYGGEIIDAMGKVSMSPPFNSKRGIATDSGTISIDVMQVAGDVLGIRLTEHWDGTTPSSTYLGNVGADGSVNFTDPQVSDTSRSVLSFFSPGFLGGRDVDKGVTWTRTASAQGLDVSSTFTIGDVVGTVADIDEMTIIKSHSVRSMDTIMTGSIMYKPTMLVPISGKIESRANRSDAETTTDVATVIHFERVSDSLDTNP